MSNFSSVKKIMTFAVLLAMMPGCSLFSPSKDSAPPAGGIIPQAKDTSVEKSIKSGSNIVSVKTQAALDAILEKHKNVVLDFWATYCPPCRVMKEYNKELAPMFPKVLFVEVDIQQASSIANKYNVHGIPNVYHIKDGNEVKHYVGKKGVAERAALIKKSFGL